MNANKRPVGAFSQWNHKRQKTSLDPKMMCIEPMSRDLVVSGPCTSCKEFYGVEQNNGRCSHCYYECGPDIYRRIALNNLRTAGVMDVMKTEYEPSEKEFNMLMKSIEISSKRRKTVCSKILFDALWSEEYFGRQVYLSARQAESLYTTTKAKGIEFCDSKDAELFIFSNVYDFWNIDADKMVEYCKLPYVDQKRPTDTRSAVILMRAVKMFLPDWKRHLVTCTRFV